MKRILPPTLFMSCIVVMAALWWALPLMQLLSFPTTVVGIIPFVIGMGLTLSGARRFDEVETNIKTFNEPDVLVIDGLFQYSRNPMYLGFVTALAGIAILLGTLSALLVVFIFFVIVDRWYIVFEEQAMIQKFGEEYKRYRSLVRRWL